MCLAVMLFNVTSETSAQVLNNTFMFNNPDSIKAGLVSNFKIMLQLSHK